ncbi:MAG TPA: HEPN domain-containing protein [Xanthomonadaceae bacterium]|nr:HEPN domain-containing protein [Xanthomonadaceae bacterium]
MTSLDELHERYRGAREGFEESLRVRLHRALSWLRRSAALEEDLDAQYLFRWIAFNAAYARDQSADEPVGSERARFGAFFAALVAVDREGRLQRELTTTFPGPVRVLIDNRYVFEPFWRAMREGDASDGWAISFEAAKRAAMNALMHNNTVTVLSIVFDRLYVLRNQLMHGGATWNSRVNRQQLTDGSRILGTLLPIMIELMMEHPERDYGEILYPVVAD